MAELKRRGHHVERVRTQRRRLPGHPDRPEDRHAPRRHRGAQGRRRRRVLKFTDLPRPSFATHFSAVSREIAEKWVAEKCITHFPD